MMRTLQTAWYYEQRITGDLEFGLTEASRFFEGKGSVHDTLHRIAKKFDDLQIPYAVVGGLALFVHGVRRFTEVVDILVSGEGLTRIHEAWDGLGFVRPFAISKNIRDTETGVKIEFLVEGQFPGDGKPKEIAFPSPSSDLVELDGVRYLGLKTLIELKLAFGMTNPDRIKDLSDVQALIKEL